MKIVRQISDILDGDALKWLSGFGLSSCQQWLSPDTKANNPLLVQPMMLDVSVVPIWCGVLEDS